MKFQMFSRVMVKRVYNWLLEHFGSPNAPSEDNEELSDKDLQGPLYTEGWKRGARLSPLRLRRGRALSPLRL